jgi:hypothetical protein
VRGVYAVLAARRGAARGGQAPQLGMVQYFAGRVEAVRVHMTDYPFHERSPTEYMFAFRVYHMFDWFVKRKYQESEMNFIGGFHEEERLGIY